MFLIWFYLFVEC